jgi:hypothetical protein
MVQVFKERPQETAPAGALSSIIPEFLSEQTT